MAFDTPYSILWKYDSSWLFCTSIMQSSPFSLSASMSTRLYLSSSSSWLLSLSRNLCILNFIPISDDRNPSSTAWLALLRSRRFIAQSNLI